MGTAYDVQARLAADAERRGDALAATVRWCLAADASGSDVERVRALGRALRSADTALHQAVYRARDPMSERNREARRNGRWEYYEAPSWRALASAAGIPLSTLNRRYRRRPQRTAPLPLDMGDGDVDRLMDPADWMEDQDDWDWEPDETDPDETDPD